MLSRSHNSARSFANLDISPSRHSWEAMTSTGRKSGHQRASSNWYEEFVWRSYCICESRVFTKNTRLPLAGVNTTAGRAPQTREPSLAPLRP
jgi:hypothetical protein